MHYLHPMNETLDVPLELLDLLKRHLYGMSGRSNMSLGETLVGDVLPLRVPRADYAVPVGQKMYVLRVAGNYSKVTRVA